MSPSLPSTRPPQPAPVPQPAPTARAAATVTPYALRCGHRARPLEVDDPAPLLSWRLASDRRDDAPAAARVVVTRDAGGADVLWDSGLLADPAAIGVRYAGAPLPARTRIHWRVELTAREGATTRAASWFETGLLDHAAWSASWIAHDRHALDVVDPPQTGATALVDHGLEPCPLLRRAFTLEAAPERARLYVTARGLYELRVNGERAGDAELAPGWTDYDQRIAYRAYDVTAALRAGDNVLAATLADGWYAGFVGFDPRRPGAHYGRVPQLLAELHLDFADGRHEVVVTDDRWRTARGGTRYADLLMGERFDPAAEPGGWSLPGFDTRAWAAARVVDRDVTTVEAAVDEPVRVTQELAPASVQRVAPGRHLVDFGQNVAGRVRLTLRDAPAGRDVTIRHAEVLDPETGGLYVANLRTAAATDVVVATGAEAQTWEPRFTFHGFRYAEVCGVAELSAGDITARVLHSDTPWAGDFACSDADVTQLWRNIAWGQRGNFLSVPTDCPQRDERLGWLADAQVFLPTAALNADVTAFFAKWLRDVRDAQAPDGAFTNVAPRIAGVADDGAPGWGDAGVLVPWHLYRTTGDERLLAEHFDAMRAWVAHVERHNPDLIWRRRVGPHFADWLSIGPPTDRELVATAYFARSARLTAEAARVLDRDDVVALTALADAVAAAFGRAFVDGAGGVLGETQTGYALALAFGLIPDGLAQRSADRLAALVQAAGPGITTGFLGVGLLAGVLDDHDHHELAHALLTRREHPSWLYPVTQGATTIWERWDGFTDERGFQAPSMNSFNHYALGSVGEWLYRGVAGLDREPDDIAWRRLRIRPRTGTLTWARATHESPRGRVEVAWERDGGALTLDVLVPPGATAVVHVPTADAGAVRADGVPVDEHADVVALGGDGATVVARVGSGRWRFDAPDPVLAPTSSLTRTPRVAGVTAAGGEGG